jgi:catalase-peroxidase
MATEWKASSTSEGLVEGLDRGTDEIKWTATRVDNSQFRAIAEVYASADSKEIFVKDFAAAWNKIVNLDRCDLHKA